MMKGTALSFNFSHNLRLHFYKWANYSLLPCFYLLRLLLGGGSAKKVKVNLEPLVDAGMNGMVLVADLLWCQTLLSGLVLCSCAILICTTYKQQVPASQTAIP